MVTVTVQSSITLRSMKASAACCSTTCTATTAVVAGSFAEERPESFSQICLCKRLPQEGILQLTSGHARRKEVINQVSEDVIMRFRSHVATI